jgi:hypothetical protein
MSPGSFDLHLLWLSRKLATRRNCLLLLAARFQAWPIILGIFSTLFNHTWRARSANGSLSGRSRPAALG